MQTQSEHKLKALRSDNGGEYVSKEFTDFCSSFRGIKREFTTPYTLAQDGVAKRMNRTIQERIMSMLSQANLPQAFWAEAFWAEALYTVVYLINRSPHASL